MTNRWERPLVASAAAYVLVVGWAMIALPYDIWGSFVVAPIVVILTVPALKLVFRGDDAIILPIAVGGLIAKLGATLFRYWVAFEAYGGAADAGAGAGATCCGI